MMKQPQREYIWLALVVTLSGTKASAATLSEMRAINATQRPGMTVVCEQHTTFAVKGIAEPVRIDTRLSGQVLQNDGDRMVFQVTHTQKKTGATQAFLTERYRLTTYLERDRQKMELDPATVSVSLPFARYLEAQQIATLRENRLSYTDYSTYRPRSLLDYDILPPPDRHDSTVMHCTTRQSEVADSGDGAP